MPVPDGLRKLQGSGVLCGICVTDTLTNGMRGQRFLIRSVALFCRETQTAYMEYIIVHHNISYDEQL